MMRGVTKFLPPRYMSVNTCCEQLIWVEENDKKGGACVRDAIAVGVARVGRYKQISRNHKISKRFPPFEDKFWNFEPKMARKKDTKIFIKQKRSF